MQIIMLVYWNESFSLYVADIRGMHVMIMDPSETLEPQDEMVAKHKQLAWKIMRNLRKCAMDHFPGWVVPRSDWRIY